jgi:hypothetical protein
LKIYQLMQVSGAWVKGEKHRRAAFFC